MPRFIDVRDLLGTPYKRGGRDPRTGLDCYTSAGVVAARVEGLAGVPSTLDEIAALESLDSAGASWGLLGRETCKATELGDIIVTDSPGAPAGLAMLVDEPNRLFITATPQRGVHLVPARALGATVVGAYRWVG